MAATRSIRWGAFGERRQRCWFALRDVPFTVGKFGVEAFDGQLIAIEREFHHVSADPSKLGAHLAQFIARDKVHVVCHDRFTVFHQGDDTCLRADGEAELSPSPRTAAQWYRVRTSSSTSAISSIRAHYSDDILFEDLGPAEGPSFIPVSFRARHQGQQRIRGTATDFQLVCQDSEGRMVHCRPGGR